MTAALLALNARTFASLKRHRNYRLFFTGQVISVSGTWMQNVALAWLVNELSGLGITLKTGEVVTTGTCLVPLPIQPGVDVTADFGSIGRVTARIV